MLAGENNQPSILMGLGVSQAAIMYYKFLYSIVAPDSLAGPYSPYYVQVITRPDTLFLTAQGGLALVMQPFNITDR